MSRLINSQEEKACKKNSPQPSELKMKFSSKSRLSEFCSRDSNCNRSNMHKTIMSTSTGVGLTWSSSQMHLPYWSSSDVLTIEDLFILRVSCYLCNTSIECPPPCESWVNIFNLCLITTPHSWTWISLDQPNWVHTHNSYWLLQNWLSIPPLPLPVYIMVQF